MNINNIIKRIKRSIGIYGIALPIDDIDNFIMEILQDTTLPVFSLYCPYIEIMSINTINLERVSRVDNADLYILPDYPGKKVLYVKKVCYDQTYLRNTCYPGYLGFDSPAGFSDLLVANVAKQTGDLLVNSITFHYEHPRKLYIYDTLISSFLNIYIAFEHDKSFQSITPTSEESFYKLALLDVKAGLYPLLKHYDGIDTAYGRIELKIDDWQGADEERKSLIETWDSSYLLDVVDLGYN